MNDEVEMPCVRGCTFPAPVDGEEPKPRPAKHGNYCNRCYFNTDKALAMIGELVEHILSMVETKNRANDGSQKTKGAPPLPLNVEAFNDANETYSRLVYWARMLAEILNLPSPTPARRAWADITGSIRGLPPDIEPATARMQAQAMATWLRNNLERICRLTGDDIDFFHDEWSDIYRLSAKWPSKAKPRYSPMPCPVSDCGARLAVYPPDEFGDDETIVCDTGHHFAPDKYEFYIRLYQEIQAEENPVKRHLLKKYGRVS